MKNLLIFIALSMLICIGSQSLSAIESTDPDTLTGRDKAVYYKDLAARVKKTNSDSGIALYKIAIELAERFNCPDVKLKSVHSIGKIYGIYKNFSFALEYLNEAERLATEMQNKTELASVYNSLGNIYVGIDNERALGYLFKTLTLYQDTLADGSPVGSRIRVSNTMLNIGVIYIQMKEYEHAETYLNQALEIRKEENYTKGLPNVLNHLANIYSKREDYDKALTYYQEALAIAQANEDKLSTGNIFYQMGALYKSQKRYDEAIESLNKGLKLQKELNLKYYEAYSYIGLVNIYMEKGEFDKAYPLITKSIKILKELGNLNSLTYAYEHLSWYYLQTGNYKKAYEAYKERADIKDSLYHQDLATSIANMEVKFETEKKEKELALLNVVIEKRDARLQLQWALIGGIGGILVLMITLGWILFTRYKLKQKQKQTELEKRSIETEQRLLRSQMNPHFIFNSLTSVQNYIGLDDKIAAISFLSKFAELIRNILVNSRESTIPLEDEIDTLKLYMDLERLRHKNGFGYTIHVSDDLSPSEVYIPPMLIQPFIENSIKHGFQDKKTDGLIELDFKKNISCIYCKITDNGMGREKAALLKEKDHRSLAFLIIQERLDVLRHLYQSELRFEITDVKDETGTVCGTEVVITLPFETD